MPLTTRMLATKSPVRRLLGAALDLATLLTGAFAASGPSHAAATFTVNSAGDARDFTPEDGRCFTGVNTQPGASENTLARESNAELKIEFSGTSCHADPGGSSFARLTTED